MIRVLQIARREFAATAMTKGFIIGGIIAPIVILAALIVVFPLLMTERAPRVVGELAVLDRSGQVGGAIEELLSPEAVAAWQQRRLGEITEAAEDAAGSLGAGNEQIGDAIRSAAERGAGEVPEITVVLLPPDADEDAEKAPIMAGADRPLADGGRLGLVIIDPDAVERAEGSEAFGGFQLFIRPKLDDRVMSLLRDQTREAVRDTRIRAGGLEPGEVLALARVEERRAIEVTQTGEREASEFLNALLPFGFMFLLLGSVFVGGQYLLTTTVEEKSSRVVEVLLSAVSPMQLMTGKVLGQLLVGLFLMSVYGVLGGGALAAMAMLYFLDTMTVVYFFVFFLIAYFTIGAFMAAIGAAVNELREAQALMTPMMAVMMIPYLLWLPITRDPNSTFSTVLSFVPAVNPFVMILRITSTEPPPAWQIVGAIAVGIATAVVTLWLAAKVFRVGLLMFGKPPNFATLLRWIRMA